MRWGRIVSQGWSTIRSATYVSHPDRPGSAKGRLEARGFHTETEASVRRAAVMSGQLKSVFPNQWSAVRIGQGLEENENEQYQIRKEVRSADSTADLSIKNSVASGKEESGLAPNGPKTAIWIGP